MSGLKMPWSSGKTQQAYTAVSDSELSDFEKEHAATKGSPRKQRHRNTFLPHIFTFFSGVAVTSLIFFLFSPRHQPSDTSSKSASSSSASAFTTATESNKNEGQFGDPFPYIPWTTSTFANNETFSARPDPVTDLAWDQLLPPGRGFTYLPPPYSHSPSTLLSPPLPPGQPTVWGPIYSVTLFHQLHCLGELRQSYFLLLSAITSLSSDSPSTDKLVEKAKKLDGPHGAHVGHCFDYLRQGLQCNGDMTLEWPREEEDGRRIAVDGWGVGHLCRDWDTIMEYMDAWHFNISAYGGIAGKGP
ncbi:MAG: hypothetical protein Q9227_007957 [Pyrenula ochraceoflavens]